MIHDLVSEVSYFGLRSERCSGSAEQAVGGYYLSRSRILNKILFFKTHKLWFMSRVSSTIDSSMMRMTRR